VGRMAGKPQPLRMRRLALGLTQREVASSAGLSLNEVSRLERGKHGPRLSTIQALAGALGCDAAAIFSLHGPANDEGPGGRNPGPVTTPTGDNRSGAVLDDEERPAGGPGAQETARHGRHADAR